MYYDDNDNDDDDIDDDDYDDDDDDDDIDIVSGSNILLRQLANEDKETTIGLLKYFPIHNEMKRDV